MYLNVICPECGTEGLVLIDGNFYNCDECNYYWEIPIKSLKNIEEFKKNIEDSKNV